MPWLSLGATKVLIHFCSRRADQILVHDARDGVIDHMHMACFATQ